MSCIQDKLGPDFMLSMATVNMDFVYNNSKIKQRASTLSSEIAS